MQGRYQGYGISSSSSIGNTGVRLIRHLTDRCKTFVIGLSPSPLTGPFLSAAAMTKRLKQSTQKTIESSWFYSHVTGHETSMCVLGVLAQLRWAIMMQSIKALDRPRRCLRTTPLVASSDFLSYHCHVEEDSPSHSHMLAAVWYAAKATSPFNY